MSSFVQCSCDCEMCEAFNSQISIDIHRLHAPDYTTDRNFSAKFRELHALALPIYMATMLAPVDSREVVRCDRCSLVQFQTSNRLCRKCHTSLDEDEPEIVEVAPLPQFMPVSNGSRGHLHLAATIRSLRLRSGLSQRQLAARMSVPRTYVSKIENEKATPTLSSLERLARALEVAVPDLLGGGAHNRQEEVRELMQDSFITEMLPFISQLNGMQLSSVLAQVRDLTVRPRRSA